MEFQEYLNSLPQKEREFTTSFFNKKEYIEKLNSIAANNCGKNIISGKGNCNSKITVICHRSDDLEFVIKFVKPMFESINTSLWNVYITSVIKTDTDDKMWEEMIQHEMNAISPKFGFYFVDNQKSFTETNFVAFNKTFPIVYINMDDVKYVLEKDNFKTERYNEIMNGLYKYILRIIQYREIELSE